MKKIILAMLIILTSFSFSNNLDKYESKRVFDKITNIMKTGDLEKYKNDPEMAGIYKELSLEDDEEFPESFKKNKYEVINVKESKKKSTLTVKATFDSFSDIPEEEVLKELQKSNDGIITETEAMNNILKKSKKETKVIKVDMIKTNGQWSFDDAAKGNDDFILTLFPILEFKYWNQDFLGE